MAPTGCPTITLLHCNDSLQELRGKSVGVAWNMSRAENQAGLEE